MSRRPPSSTRTYTLLPYTPLFRACRVIAAQREPILALPVPPQRHQLGRGSHRAHHLVELILAVAVPERELRQVAPGERRPLAGDRVQCDFQPGDDLLAVLARDPCMVLDPLGLKPLFGHPRRRRPDLVVGFKFDALRLQRPVTFAGVSFQLGQPLVYLDRKSVVEVPSESILVALGGLGLIKTKKT